MKRAKSEIEVSNEALVQALKKSRRKFSENLEEILPVIPQINKKKRAELESKLEKCDAPLRFVGNFPTSPNLV